MVQSFGLGCVSFTALCSGFRLLRFAWTNFCRLLWVLHAIPVMVFTGFVTCCCRVPGFVSACGMQL